MYYWPSSLFASITKLAVKENYRKQGHGEALMKAAIEKCRKRKVQRVSLHVDPLRTPAVGLYNKLGMGRLMRSCIQSILKLLNSVIGMVGLGMILYAVWLIRVWQREMGDLPFDDSDNLAPWFIYTFLGLGVTLCVITCLGHVAAETANGCCLYLYMLFVFLLFMLEAGVTADVFLNRDWEKDFPDDPSGNFNQFKDFIRKNFEMCKLIGFSILSVQGLSFLLALILKALGPHQYYDSDDEYASDRVPLLNNAAAPPSYVVGNPIVGSKNDAWSIRINEKVSLANR